MARLMPTGLGYSLPIENRIWKNIDEHPHDVILMLLAHFGLLKALAVWKSTSKGQTCLFSCPSKVQAVDA